MPIFNTGILKSQARTKLQDTSVTKLVLLHTGVLLLLSILASGINLLLDDQISATGGLSGVGTRSLLQSLQTFLQYATSLFAPFWHAGFTCGMLQLARGATPNEKDLLGGFKRWGAVISLQIFTSVLLFGAVLTCGYLTATVFAITPFADPLVELVLPVMESGTFDPSSVPTDALLEACFPLLVIYLVILLPFMLYFSLGIRLSPYLILDHKMGGFMALHFSMVAMRRKRMKMLKLDLSFWWYYLTELVLSIVCFLDIILPLFGVHLPMNETIAFFGAMILYAILELAFHVWKKPYHDLTYTLAYQEILHSMEIPQQSN